MTTGTRHSQSLLSVGGKTRAWSLSSVESRSYTLMYVFLGFYCGFILGESLKKDVSLIAGRILYCGAILLAGLYWRTIDASSHQHHLTVWLDVRRKGKWRFILTRYILLRGGLMLALFGSPLYFNFDSAIVAGRTNALLAVVLVVMMILLGHIEWRYCEQDSNILAIKRAAEEANQHVAMYN
jgi:hypothetical protein